MRSIFCNTSIPFQQPQISNSKPSFLIPNWTNKTLIGLLSGALSFGLLTSSPSYSSLALESPSQLQLEYCREQDLVEDLGSESEVVTNEGIVEEAWEIVNESFLDTSRFHRWSPETWQVKKKKVLCIGFCFIIFHNNPILVLMGFLWFQRKKEDIRSTSIQSRSKAHDIIKRMLASLSDPYTRFLSPEQVPKMVICNIIWMLLVLLVGLFSFSSFILK